MHQLQKSPTLYYFAGILLRKHGEMALADEYLRTAATAYNDMQFGCMLANYALRNDQKVIGPMRLDNASDATGQRIRCDCTV